ncbi:MAG: hypothetical protein WCV62_03415 [Candidatus Peribacteraceae bacterium]|jgi:hypothetical protein
MNNTPGRPEENDGNEFIFEGIELDPDELQQLLDGTRESAGDVLNGSQELGLPVTVTEEDRPLLELAKKHRAAASPDVADIPDPFLGMSTADFERFLREETKEEPK